MLCQLVCLKRSPHGSAALTHWPAIIQEPTCYLSQSLLETHTEIGSLPTSVLLRARQSFITSASQSIESPPIILREWKSFVKLNPPPQEPLSANILARNQGPERQIIHSSSQCNDTDCLLG
ncbi:hypothetical protein LIA77_04260 [Sarocladium implicatum]|nr:hypothetical protein LIA77_04260 [Sarocladium implicatum]